MESSSFSDMNQTIRKKRSDRRPRHNSTNRLIDAELTSTVTSNPESSDDKDTCVDIKTPAISDAHNSDAHGVHNVVKKLKLKVGGLIHTNSCILKHPQDTINQDTRSGLRGIPWKDFSRSGLHVGKVDSSRHDSVHKSKRVPKKRLLDDVINDDDEDDAELRYLAKKSAEVDDEDEGGSKKQRKISSVLNMECIKKPRMGRESEDSSREMSVTTRSQALQSGREYSNDSTASIVEFPHGLPPAPPRKQKEKLSVVEHQLKKVEAAQRRKIQAAKAARESEAEAIRKILGQDSSRKKRENKMKQRKEELTQERNSNAATLALNTVRWVIRPTGTVVSFSDDIGLPNIFESRPCSYPPPREKCVGPSCSKPFKYRDSRSKLPLCSFQCYKAIQEKTHSGAVY